jgi:NDMA-dependent alcohol dehydrogenase
MKRGSTVKTHGAICWERGGKWIVEEIELNPPGPGEVLVEWKAAGLCHSDEHLRNGDRVSAEAEPAMYPLLGGHEGAGVVAEVGAGVTKFEVGDQVLSSFAPTCGTCRYCVSGRGYICNGNAGFLLPGQLEDGSIKHRVRGRELNVLGKLGTFAERTVVSARSINRVSADLPPASICLLSCGVATGWGSAVERGDTKPGDIVVVVGLGGLGAGAVQGARLAGAGRIVAIDPFEFRRDAARRFGATDTFASMADARETIMHYTDGQGADVVILTPGVVTGEIIHDGLALTGKGAVCVVTGMGLIGESSVPIDLGAFALFSKELRGCLYGALDPRVTAERLITLYRQGQLDLDNMVTTYALADINKALDDTTNGRVVRAVVTM